MHHLKIIDVLTVCSEIHTEKYILWAESTNFNVRSSNAYEHLFRSDTMTPYLDTKHLFVNS